MAFKKIRQPESLKERIELATRMKSEYEMPMSVMVDTMEDQSRAYFSELPSPVFMINAQGVIEAKFPWPDLEQIREALDEVYERTNYSPVDSHPAGQFR